MKCSLIKLSLTCLIVFLITINISYSNSTLLNVKNQHKSKSLTRSESLNESKSLNESTFEILFNENEAKFFSKFSKNANCAEKPLAQSCPGCLTENAGYKFFFYFQTTRMKKFNYKLMIHFNDVQKKIVVTFAGPSVQQHHRYVKFIYTKGFSMVKLYNVNVEKEFALIYFGKLKPLLTKKIKEIKVSGRGNYQYIFNGYSIGGSLATLAAFDLSKSNSDIKNPQVYTYGSLRIGDASFVALVNSQIKVWRIIKSTDYIVRIPTCFFEKKLNAWKCYTQPAINKFVLTKTYPLQIYVKNYIISFRESNTVLAKALIIDNKVTAVKKQRKALKKAGIKTRAQTLKKATKAAKKPLVKAIRTSPRTAKKGAPISKNKIKSVKKTKAMNLASPRVLTAKKQRKDKKDKKKERKERKQEAVKSPAKKDATAKKDLEASKKKTLDASKKTEKVKKAKSPKKSLPTLPMPIPMSIPTPVSGSTKLTYTPYIPSITTFTAIKTYTPAQVYFNFIYYTQPIGYEIFYNEAMTTYQSCQYANGVSICEKSVVLPETFKSDSHREYYGEKFDQCKP